MRGSLERLDLLRQIHGFRVLAAVLPVGEEYGDPVCSRLYDKVLGVAHDIGFETVRAADAFEGEPASFFAKPDARGDMAHPNSEGHRRIGDAIATAVRGMLSTPTVGPWRARLYSLCAGGYCRRLMRRAWYRVTSTTFLAVLTLSAGVAAAQPGSPGPRAGGPPPSEVQIPEPCDPAAAAWAKGASQHSGLDISALACPTGVVRLHVEGAGCDFEVSRARGFERTTDGKLGVSPIVNLDWSLAPAPMKKALAGVLAALAADPSLPIREGDPVRHADQGAMRLGSRHNQIIAGSAGGALVVAAGVGFWMMKRRRAKAVASPEPVAPPPEPEPEPAVAPEPPAA